MARQNIATATDEKGEIVGVMTRTRKPFRRCATMVEVKWLISPTMLVKIEAEALLE